MSTSPIITIFVRHAADCKYAGDEFEKRCRCRKHLRWTANGTQQRRMAGTRSWAEAETAKRELEDQLSGRAPERAESSKDIPTGIEVFLTDKKVQGVTPSVLGKYTRELIRFREFCWAQGVYQVQGITRELLTSFCGTWEGAYPSSTTRAKVRERLRSFLRYCYEAQWIARIPALPKIKIDEPPTMPLTTEEYAKLLDSIYGTVETKAAQKKVHALFQLMRYSGLAITDALTLERPELQFDKTKKIYRVVTDRQKTGTSVSVPIPADVAAELIEVLNGNPKYIFWSGNGQGETIAKHYAKEYIAPVFKAAGLDDGGHMKSHRLRDTFAVDLLQKGVPLEEVSKLLGHRSIKTTEMHYAKWVKGRQDRLDTLVSDTWKK